MVEVKLSGGIGNQLFQYFEGARKSLEDNEPLVLDFSGIFLGKSKHSSLISSFHLPVPAACINVNPSGFSIWRQKILLALKNKISNKSIQFIHLDAMHSQTWKNFEYIASKIDIGMELKNPSNWYESMSEEIQSAPMIAIHIRRGDYLLSRNRNTIGVLHGAYYKECVERVFEKVGNLPILVFSDSEDIDEELRDSLPADAKYIQPPSGTDPAETIALMSLARVLIISNSTFSWWAAALSNESTSVYCPATWFKNLDQPKDLLLESWNFVESKWITYDN